MANDMQRDNPILLILVAVLGLSGVAVVTRDSPKLQGGKDGAGETAAGSPVATPMPCGNGPIGVLCAYFGVDDEGRAKREFREADSRVVIATLPDPLDSEGGFGFDQRLETIRMAVVAAGFQPDRFYLPWARAGKVDASGSGAQPEAAIVVATSARERSLNLQVLPSPPARPARPPHRSKPGALLFRRPGDAGAAPALLLLLLVGETPTFGADPEVVSATVRLANELLSPHRNRDLSGRPTLPVIGPSFSGAIEPWRREVLAWNRADHEGSGPGPSEPRARLRFVSGTATSTHELGRLASPAPCCSADVQSYGAPAEEVNEALRRFFAAHLARHGDQMRVALVHEADTPYGQSFTKIAGGDWTFLPYPLHVSQLWAAHLERGRWRASSEQLDADARASLTLLPEGPQDPIDLPPSLYPGSAANVSERVLSNLMLRMSALDVDFVGIVGSNVSDIVFLTHLIRQQAPNAIIFTTNSHFLLTHPRHTEDLHGLWMVTPWYYDPRIVLPGGGTKQILLHLPSAGDIGTFRATLEGVCSILRKGDSKKRGTACRRRIGPRWNAAGSRPSHGKTLWLTAIGRGAIWPVDVLPSASSEQARRGARGSPPAGFMSLMLGVSTLTLLVSFVYWAHAFGWRLTWPVFGAIAWSGERHRAGCRAGYPLLAFLLALGAAGFYPVCAWVARSPDAQNGLTGLDRLLTDPQYRLITASVVAVTCAVVTLCLAALREAGVGSRSTSAPAPPRTWLPWALTLGILAMGVAVSRHLCGRPSRLSDFVAAQRAVHLTSGLSPIMPWLFLSAGLMVLAYAGTRRRYLLRVADALANATRFRAATTELCALVEGFRNAIASPPPSLQQPTTLLTLRTIVATLASGGTALMLWRHGVVTMESQSFGVVLAGLLVVLSGGAAHLAARAFDVWQRLRRLLRSLAWGPLADAFDRVPPELARTTGIRWSSEPAAASELRYDVDQVSLLTRLAQRECETDSALLQLADLRSWGEHRREIESELEAIARGPRWTFVHETRAQGTLSGLAGQIMRSYLLPTWAVTPNPRPQDPPEGAGDDGRLDVMTAHRRQPDTTLRLAEEFVAVEIVRFVSYASAHLKNLLASAIAVFVLALLGVASYPFRPQQLVMRWLGVGFGATIILTLAILVQVERNEVLSRIANRTPNRVGFDATFLMQIVTYVLLPVTAILVTQFPALSRPLSGLFGALAGG